MPDGKKHSILTKAVLDMLSPYFKLPENEHEALIEQYCCYPDTFFSSDKSVYENILPYMFIKDGIQFHYLPDTPLNELYRYWLPKLEEQRLGKSRPFHNSNFFHARAGFEFYLNNMVKYFEDDNYREGAKFTGCLLHMLEDSSFGAHSLEGPYGTDIFVLERLFGEPDDLGKTPLNILKALDCSRVKPFDYTPKLLGENVPEIAMHLYAAYVKNAASSRQLCFKIVRNVYDGRENENPELIQKMFSKTIKICTDMLFSALSVAKHELKDSGHLKTISLTELEPFEFPLGGSGGYRFLSCLKDIAVDSNMRKIPLQLKLGDEIISFDRGLSFGSHYEVALCYWIPEDLYSGFEACIGLHPDSLNPESGVKIEIINNGKIVQELEFKETSSAEKLLLKNPRGKFGFKVSYIKGYPHSTNIIVIGSPILQK